MDTAVARSPVGGAIFVQSARPIKVLLVDDHLVVREGIRAMLAGEPDILVVGEAPSGGEAVQKAVDLQPDVVLLDIRMPDVTGTEAVKRIKSARPGTSIIMLTMYDSNMYVVEAIKAGAAGYLTKDVSRELLCHAIRSVMDGGMTVRTGLLKRAIDAISRTSGAIDQDSARTAVDHLTPRELDVLRLVARGLGNKDICEELHLAEVTVKKYVQSVIQKLGVSDRTNAALHAVRFGLVE